MDQLLLLQSGQELVLLPEWADLPVMGLKLLVDLIAVWLIVFKVYKPAASDGHYIFTFLIFNVLIFFLCLLMVKVELGLGFAFGLFALFSIMRYRTMTIHIKEMTYLFSVISLAVINSIYGAELSLFEILFINILIVALVYFTDRAVFSKMPGSIRLLYERIDLIHKNESEQLIEDLKKRTGLNVIKIEVESINFMNDTAFLQVYFLPTPEDLKTENSGIRFKKKIPRERTREIEV